MLKIVIKLLCKGACGYEDIRINCALSGNKEQALNVMFIAWEG